ncbi:MAG: hypothetical protein EKK65_12000, partial [Lysobacterales bacterium]
MTTPPADGELQTLQREVQRLLGRCLLCLQQYERLIKALVAHHEIDGPVDALESSRAKRIANVAGKTLGNLVSQLLGSYLVSEEADTSDEITARTASDTVSFGMRMQLSMSADDYARIESGLKELVQLRNSLVHHFMDQHDLWSLEGCQGAHDALLAACSRIDQHFEQLRGWAVQMDQVRKLMAEFVQSNAGYDLIVNGIAPDETVYWPAAGIVHELRNAARELAVDGWTPVAVAGRWIADRDPEQQPVKYGCSSWRQVVHESRQF